MQTFITNYNFYKSAENLDVKRRMSQIYESIHILASLLDMNDKLINPKRNIKNHPVAKLWEGYETWLFNYITCHIVIWINKSKKTIKEILETITIRNYSLLSIKIKNHFPTFIDKNYPYWITDKLIKIHRSVLIQKKPDFYKKLWPGVPDNLIMKYDFRKDKI